MKLKTKQQLLESFVKANKVRKIILANRAGFDTPEDYKEHLIAQVKLEVKLDTVAKCENILVVNPITITENVEKPLDMVIAFDTTGSMSSYIDEVKKRVTTMLKEMFSKSTGGLRVKIVAFGDYCDMPNRQSNIFGDAYQESPLTNDIEILAAFVNDVKNTRGGDSDEFYELVIQKIVNETPWGKDHNKTIFLIGDAEPHGASYCYAGTTYNVDWELEVENAANLGITIDTLSINGYPFYEEVSKRTNGVCIPFKNAQKLDQVLQASTYAKTSKKTFRSMQAEAEKSGDVELMGAYKSMESLIK